jgi:hypothetical protein
MLFHLNCPNFDEFWFTTEKNTLDSKLTKRKSYDCYFQDGRRRHLGKSVMRFRVCIDCSFQLIVVPSVLKQQNDISEKRQRIAF